ncbi:MAG: hypothetical protein SFY95_12165 [Planctomycetota bacterium]|nr:hypothetical protein [Planctomycetota bacterium]
MASRAANNFWAGTFLTASVLGGVIVAFVLSDLDILTSLRTYEVKFTVGDGVAGVKPGSAVLLGGNQVGRVTAVRPLLSGDGAVSHWLVRIKIGSDYKLYSNAVINLERPLIGSLSTINIRDPGRKGLASDGGAAESSMLAENSIIEGKPLPGILAQAGLSSEDISNIPKVLKNVTDLIEANKPKVDGTIDDLRDSARTVAEAVSSVEAKLPIWVQRVEDMTRDLTDGAREIRSLADAARGVVDESDRVVRNLGGSLARSLPTMERIVINADAIMDQFRYESMDSVRRSLALAESMMESGRGAVAELRRLVDAQSPGLARTLANFRLTSDQLKLTMMEVRAQPWRLLYQPTRKEEQTQLLYDATRQFAQSMSDLRAASDALSSYVRPESGEGTLRLTDPMASSQDLEKALRDLRARIDEATSRSREAEAELLKQLKQAE